ncbi:hypothetical protein [Pantoea sp. 18069]|uniref:hypothetical protein n=1 Tax=Pantoea sp. 18069 TaxID=2681415 RepID=UPI00135C92F2|nr:hypothetical protein [Pantoea sp. 18069]
MKKPLIALLALLGIQHHLSAEQRDDIAGALYQATPGAVTAGSFRLVGLPLSDWLVLASIAFVALQAAYLIWKWRRDSRQEARAARRAELLEKSCVSDRGPA